MNRLILYAYPPLAMLACIFTVLSGKDTALCSGGILALIFLLLPLWLLAVATYVNESAADDDLYDNYSIEISYRGRKRDGDH